MQIDRVAVIGAGVIGRGVAQDLVQTGHHVVVIDVSDEVLTAARAEIERSLRLHHLVAPGAARQDRAQLMGNLVFSTDYENLADVDFVVENTTESVAVKRHVYRDLDRWCPPRTVFAANTSAIPIGTLAAATARPEQLVGMHFMNPVPLKPVVEVIRGDRTSDATLHATRQLLEQMGKEGIEVNDGPGFVSNRVLMLAINEAILTVQDDVAEPQQVDAIFKKCFGHEMGPLETGDLIGLDTILRTLEVLQAEFADDKYRPASLLQEMVANGLLGRKAGRGFFTYGAAVNREEPRDV
jgi:3-hydroxybutyryl-CoA dehydrogenase